MLPIRYLSSFSLPNRANFLRFRNTVRYSSSSSDSSDSSSSDDENESQKKLHIATEDPTQKAVDASQKLNMLLAAMAKDDYFRRTNREENSMFAKASDKRKKSAAERKAAMMTEEEKLVKAAKDVAKRVGGDVQQTQSALLSKLLSHSEDVTKLKEEPVGTKPGANLSELIAGMTIDRSQSPESVAQQQSRAQQVRRILGDQQKSRRPMKQPIDPTESFTEQTAPKTTIGRVNLFGSDRLGIFKKREGDGAKGLVLETWEYLNERELKLAVTHPPANIYEEMILWTEQGKLWKFPIDNEQGLVEEAKFSFVDHIFLERHLEPWCPKRGPVRHFMELVCTGLSKNNYLTVQEKLRHIANYKSYFEEKQELLKEVGSWDFTSEPGDKIQENKDTKSV